ncbi:LOW QUALITY PROTEIN: protein SCO1 homolog 2, mitochondrial-like [Prunus dulcis]|uniref:LOW QUALITY PROTEIN: protein SCO1 homolog 2, mitochondrial-like n=1 Tax=Prunus dulcis TaxID=3755 RepID=UPI00148362F4|nr:LOW QUALITY PROTEIN: protein SCO1 homolog 2, mitochondrial-like [Prunus dulcis]
MPFSRFLFFSAKQRSIEAFNLLRRSGLPKRIHSRSYANSSKSANGKTDIRPPMTVETPAASRTRASYVIPAAGVLFFAGLATFIHYNDERRVTLKGQGNCPCVNNLRGPIIGGPFTLVDMENHTVTERNLLGNWVLLYFGYTSSPDVGPEQLQLMAKAINILESRHNFKILPVFVTLDPQRDTPSHLRAYLKEFESRIVGLTGPVSAIRQMAQEYRAYFRKVEEEGDDYLVECSHNMYLMNPNMEVVRCIGVEYNTDELSEAIVKEVKRTSTDKS